MRPGDTIKRVDASTEPATVFLEVCDENGEVKIWQGTSTANVADVPEGMASRRSVFVDEDVTEDLTNTGSRVRTSGELAKAEKLDAADADKAAREAAAAGARSVVDGELVARSASGETLSGSEQTALLTELSAAVRDLTLLVEALSVE